MIHNIQLLSEFFRLLTFRIVLIPAINTVIGKWILIMVIENNSDKIFGRKGLENAPLNKVFDFSL